MKATIDDQVDLVRDVNFDDALDVGSIRYRLHPLDVGWQLKGSGTPVVIDESEPSLRVSYADRNGERRVMEGPRAAVTARLEKLGYEIVDESAT